MFRIIVIVIVITSLFSPYKGNSCCGQDAYRSVTELLNDPTESRYPNHKPRSIFIIKIDSTWNDLQNGFMNSGIVQKVYRGNLQSGKRYKIGSGGNTSAGGSRLKEGDEYIIFSRPNKKNVFYAFVCDGFSRGISYQDQNYGYTIEEYLKTIDEYFELKKSKYSGKKVFTFMGKTLAKGEFKNGLPHGKWKHYNAGGKKKSLLSVNHYDHGLQHGEEKIYRGYGKKQIKTIKKFDQGKEIERINYSSQENDLFISSITTTRYLENNSKQQSITEYYTADQIHKNYNRLFTNVKSHNSYFPYSFINGKFISYHENGQVKEKGEYYRGAKIFEWYTYHENGTLEKKEYYKKPKDKKKFIIYYDNGNPRLEGQIINGKKEGLWKSYNRKGEIYQLQNFENNLPHGKSQSFSGDEKNLSRLEYFINGKLHGESKYFHQDGKTLSSITIYNHGKKEGKHNYYFKDGSLRSSSFYKNDLLQGEEVQYHGPNLIEHRKNYINGLLEGKAEYFDIKGQLRREGNYKKGTKVGTWNTYSITGELKKIYYD